MYSMVVADDEPAIRFGLKRLLPLEEYGLEVAAEASNGEEALARLRERRPHVLITDIRMPVMDGLALLRAARAEFPHMRCIVLSGYNDFALVKEALKYEVDNYLLKPVDREELAATLDDVIRKLDRQASEALLRREGFEVLKNNVLNRLIGGQISSREFRDKARFLSIPTDGQELLAAIVTIRQEGVPDKDRHLLDYAVMKVCEETLADPGDLAFTDHAGRTVVVFQRRRLSSREAAVTLETMLDNVSSYLRLTAVAALGGRTDTFRGLAASYRQAAESLDYALWQEDARVARYDLLAHRQASLLRDLELDHARLDDMLRGGRADELAQTIRGCFAELRRREDARPELARLAAQEIWVTLLRAARQSGADDRELARLRERWLRAGAGAQPADSLAELLCETAAHCARLAAKAGEQPHSRLVKEMIGYVQRHLASEISLKTLSPLLQASPAHLGKTFRAETGELFSDFVNRMRVEEAKRLLDRSHLKIGDIPGKVGFWNANYFFTVFKKYVGVTPSEYRERQGRGEELPGP